MPSDQMGSPTEIERQEHLFTLRLWREELEEGQSEWRGRLYHTGTGEVRHFREWASLIPLLLAILHDSEQSSRRKDE